MQNKGFTLIELIIIIAIMGIITSTFIPRNRASDYRLYSQARLLTNEIRMTRYKVMTEGGFQGIVINENSYSIVNDSKVIRKVELGEDFHITENLGSKIKFDLNGIPIKGGSITIKDKHTKKSHIITIVPYTGRVLLKE